MPFFSNLKKVLSLGSGEAKKKKPNLSHICVDEDPEGRWEIVGDLGDGAFGKVHKVRRRDATVHDEELYAAAKICVLESDEELNDFMVEIDILTAVQHPNIIGLHEAYFFQNKLWVRRAFFFSSEAYFLEALQVFFLATFSISVFMFLLLRRIIAMSVSE